jgi:hypothetical protein
MKLSRIKRPKALWWQIRNPDGLPLPKRSRIKPRSSGMAKRMREYVKLKAAWITGRSCEFPGCRQPASDIHHKRGRAGALLLLTRFWAGVCSAHHRWIHENPQAARELCLLANQGEWNTLPDQFSRQGVNPELSLNSERK